MKKKKYHSLNNSKIL